MEITNDTNHYQWNTHRFALVLSSHHSWSWILSRRQRRRSHHQHPMGMDRTTHYPPSSPHRDYRMLSSASCSDPPTPSQPRYVRWNRRTNMVESLPPPPPRLHHTSQKRVTRMQQKDIWIIILLWTLSSLGSAIGSSLIIITSAWTGHLGQGISCCCSSLYLLSLYCLSHAFTYTWHHRHALFHHKKKHTQTW